MRRMVRRFVLWALPELRATVEREQWLALFYEALQQQAQQSAPQPHRPEVN